MRAPYRVALQGFSEFERATLTYCLKQASTREPGYTHVELIADSDFIVADASHEPIVGSAVRSGRLHDTLFVGGNPPQGARAHLERPIDPERILRTLDQMTGMNGAAVHGGRAAVAPPSAPLIAPAVVAPATAPERPDPLFDPRAGPDTIPAPLDPEALSVTFTDMQTWDEVDSSLQQLQLLDPPAASVAMVRPDGPPAAQKPAAPLADPFAPSTAAVDGEAWVPQPARRPPLSDAERAAAKAEARRASRRARLRQSARAAADAPRDVLLYDPASGPLALTALLEAFGFTVHRAENVATAVGLLSRVPLAAAFLDADSQDGLGLDGLELCQRVKNRRIALAGKVPAVMLVSGRQSPAERVRGKLAGCDAFLTRPVTRGDAARALEACDVALPADARRA